MGKPLRLLIVEDEENDAYLLVRELERAGFEVIHERVDTENAMSAALDRQPWDLILSDYFMPKFSGPAALTLLKAKKLDLPFIIVSGTVGEETAVEAIKAGAHDFIPKGRFTRLVPAIERELRDAAMRVERTRMQEQLLISERMASIGTLAAGVAHEINNPLAALMANLEFASEDLGKLLDGARARPGDAVGGAVATRLEGLGGTLTNAHEAAERIRVIVRDLKTLSRSDGEKREAVDIRRVMDSSLRIAGNEIRHRARVVREFADVPAVDGNESRLGQVFLNLLVNAAQAIPEGHFERNEIRVVIRPDSESRVAVEIHDTGSGIPDAVISRIFDPFFTTKAIGTGTGLGLAICHRIITALGGEIQVQSQPGKGTVVRTLLPVATTVTEASAPPPPGPAASIRARVLVIDDEPMLGKAITRMLSPEHDAIATSSARDALDLIARGEVFDVVLCDLMMPDMTGMELHAELLKRHPTLAAKMVFMTGGAFTAPLRAFLDGFASRRIEKPFTSDAVRGLIDAFLSRRG